MTAPRKNIAKAALESGFLALADRTCVYDVFFWEEDGADKYVSVPWASFTDRAIPVRKTETGAWTNSAPLPNGLAEGAATYAGSIYKGNITDG